MPHCSCHLLAHRPHSPAPRHYPPPPAHAPPFCRASSQAPHNSPHHTTAYHTTHRRTHTHATGCQRAAAPAVQHPLSTRGTCAPPCPAPARWGVCCTSPWAPCGSWQRSRPTSHSRRWGGPGEGGGTEQVGERAECQQAGTYQCNGDMSAKPGRHHSRGPAASWSRAAAVQHPGPRHRPTVCPCAAIRSPSSLAFSALLPARCLPCCP